MAEVRYTGDSVDGVDLTDPQVHMDRMEWVDVPYDVARSLAKQDDFELRASKRAAKTKTESASPADDTESAPPADEKE